MNKKVIAGFIIAAACVPLAASALSVDEIQAKLKDLLSQVASLQEQLAVHVSTDASTAVQTDGEISVTALPRICKILPVRTLALGVRSDEVRNLQEFLQSEGVLQADATGYFGGQTRAALGEWQMQNGVVTSANPGLGWGTVGPKTRAAIAHWCQNPKSGSVLNAKPQSGPAPLDVAFSATFRSYGSGYSYSLDFGDGTSTNVEPTAVPCMSIMDCPVQVQAHHTYTTNGTYIAALYVDNPGGCGPNADPRCLGAPAMHGEIGRAQIRVGTISPACAPGGVPVCGAKQVVCITAPCNPVQKTYVSRCELTADGATYLHDGVCTDTSTTNPADDPQCKAWYDGCNSCSRETPGAPGMCTLRYCIRQAPAYCTAWFDDSPAENRPPSIASFSGPTALNLNQVGTWNVRATDPENGQLTYSIEWGDEWTPPTYMGAAFPENASIQQQTSFTHSYANAGTYTVRITVQDSAGATAQATATVYVGTTAYCTMEYNPVCGRPTGCANTCAPGSLYCPGMCAMPDPVTYSNRCNLNAAGATYLHAGACNGTE